MALRLTGVLLWLTAGHSLAQTVTNNIAAPLTNAPPASLKKPADKTWSFSASVYGHSVPESRDYLQPTAAADHGWLHLEARYNYEGLDTGSTWVGYNFGGGEKLAWEFTPMLGGVFGDTTGIAPGYRVSLTCWKLALASEGEYLFDTGDSSASFFYTWSELSLAPVEWFRFGLAVQRTKLYKTEFDIQRGFLIGFNYKKVNFTTYVFNPDASRPTLVLGLGVAF